MHPCYITCPSTRKLGSKHQILTAAVAAAATCNSVTSLSGDPDHNPTLLMDAGTVLVGASLVCTKYFRFPDLDHFNSLYLSHHRLSNVMAFSVHSNSFITYLLILLLYHIMTSSPWFIGKHGCIFGRCLIMRSLNIINRHVFRFY